MSYPRHRHIGHVNKCYLLQLLLGQDMLRYRHIHAATPIPGDVGNM